MSEIKALKKYERLAGFIKRGQKVLEYEWYKWFHDHPDAFKEVNDEN